MAEMKIGKIYFGKDDLQYGLELCLANAGRVASIVDCRTAQAVDVLLVSFFWFRDIYYFEKFLRDSGLKNRTKKPIIVAGGMQATMTPEIISQMVDYVFIGDGEGDLKLILDEIEAGIKPTSKHLYTKNSEGVPLPCECVPSGFKIEKKATQLVTRIEIARGCRFKCSFCCLSNLKPYREVETEKVIEQINATRGKLVSVFAPERTCHSGWSEIEASIEKKGLKDFGQDARLENIHKVKSNTVTFGLEGISYSLRKSIKKPFTEDFIIERLGAFVESKNKVCMVSAYFIADLPGETDDDWKELYQLFARIEKENWSRFFTFKPILNPLSPKNFTPLVNSPVHVFRDYKKTWSNLMRKNGSRWGFRIAETMVWSPWLRLIDVIVNKGGGEAYKIISRMPYKYLTGTPLSTDQKFLCISVLNECRKIGIYDKLQVIEGEK